MSDDPMPMTAAIYNQAADRWVRREPQSLSDYTGRPVVFDLCGDVREKVILDMGCGEGYCARVLVEKGASSIDGIDISEKMIKAANKASCDDERFRFAVGSATELGFQDQQFDLVLGIFVYNYLTIEDMLASFKEAFRVLKPGGDFIFSVPHPVFALVHRTLEKPFFFDLREKGYFSARDTRFFGEIHRRDGQSLPVEMTHKIFEDYMANLAAAGFTQIPCVKEMGVLEEHLAIDSEFFQPLVDKPLHMAFKTKKPVSVEP